MGQLPSASSTTPLHSEPISSPRPYSRICREGNHRTCATPTLFPLQNFHGAEKGRRESPHHNRPVSSQCSHQSPSDLLRESHESCQKYDSSSLSRLPRHQGGIHTCANSSEPPQVSSVLISAPTLLLPGPSLRPLLGTIHLHKDPLLASPPSPQPGDLHSRLSGRHSPVAQVGSHSQSPPHCLHSTLPAPGFYHSSDQVAIDTPTCDALAGHSLVWPNRPLVCTSGVPGRHHETGTIARDSKNDHTQRVGGTTGQTELCVPSAPPPTDLPPTSLQGALPSTSGSARPGRSSPRLSQRSVTVLDDTSPMAPHSAISLFGSLKSPMDRCFNKRVGSRFRRQLVLQRSVAFSRTNDPHKRPRDASCPPRNSTFRLGGLSGGTLHGQRGGPLRHRQTSRQVRHTPQRICLAEPLVRRPSRSPVRHTHSHSLERSSGRPQQNATPGHGVETSPDQFSRSGELGGSHASRSVCDSPQLTSSSICHALPPPESHCHKRTVLRLEQIPVDLSIPTDQSHSSNPPASHNIQGEGDSGGTLGPLNTVVPCATTTGQRPPTSSHGGIPALPPGESHPLLRHLKTMDRLPFLRLILLKTSSEQVVETMLASYRKSSNDQHEVAWTALKNWLSPLVNVITVQTMQNFFQYLFDVRKLAPNTIMNYRNSLSWPLKEAFNLDLHRDEFSKLMKGFFHLRPPQPTSVPEWDLGLVLNYYENLPEPLSNKNLFFKCLLLLALATGNRCSELSAFCRDGVIFTNSGVTIPLRPHFLFKNQTLRRTPPPIHVPTFNYPLMCPVRFLKRYIASCSPSDNSRALFVNPSSFASLNAGRIGYWLVQAIRNAHADKPVVKPHDVRKLAYSANWARKTDLQAIVQHGFWASAHPFLNNYLVSLPDPLPHFIAAGSSI